ncbi:MAG: benzoyl-CoA reductase subunit B [Phycisphaerales bacterium]|nr:MAG: benzoyl-CoA reductase subunit B [Phycisphaerales bacterium]
MQTQTAPDKDYRGTVHTLSRDIMTDWMTELKTAARVPVPSAYLMISGNCVEILRCFDILPVFPEINALQLAIRKNSLPYIIKSEEIGYASDNCAYVKADVGFTLCGGVGESGTIPKPSLIVCNFVGCNVYIKWFEHCASMMNVPMVILDIPFVREDKPSREDIEYVMCQLRELIAECERLTGRKFDIDRLREILRESARAERGWTRAKELCKHRPAPFDAYFDSINMMGPINALRGTKEAADFFDRIVEEYERMVADGVGVLDEERFRMVVEGPPPYPYYRNFRNLFETWGAVAVQSTYSTVGGTWEFGFCHDPDRPLESIAEQMIVHNLCNRSMLERYRQIKCYVEDWHADALVIHSIKSCRLFSAGQGDMREYFTKDLGVPTLMVESDLEDPRYYAEAQMKNRIDAFFEALQYKRLRQGGGGFSDAPAGTMKS